MIKIETKEQGIDFTKLGYNELIDICAANNIQYIGLEKEQIIRLIENDRL